MKERYKQFFENNEFLTLYHGTDSLFINKIKARGLESKTGYDSPSWFMLSSTKPSAIFHSVYSPEDNRLPYLVTLQIPVLNMERPYWKGYPYVWKGEKMSGNFFWYALKQPIPKNFIKKIEPINVELWKKIKSQEVSW
jgi:hypothetical protein